ncbi:MAG: preprotein translocase subunit YajC [Alphaproteobacteria bacterium]|jgi:preprotein translocase subunit YajC|nr:preprotein translocase subunit YajC [Alphaproteobacteria bacterium]
MLTTPAFAQAAGAVGTGDIIMQMVPFVAMIAIFYIFLIRPQQRRAKEHRAKIDAVRRGDQIITSGGLKGKVTKVGDEDVEVELAENVRVQVVKATLADVISKTEPVKNA